MHLLCIHADRFSFERTSDIERPDVAGSETTQAGNLSGCLVVFATIEASDGNAAVGEARAAVESVTDQLDTRQVAIYSTSHLSENAAERAAAIDVLDELESALDDDHEVLSVPPGWNKRVELVRKGHPHAVQSHRITAGTRAESSREREWLVLSRDGHTRPLSAVGTDTGQSLRELARAQRDSVQSDHAKHPASAEALSTAGLISDESSDGMTLTPRGTVVRDGLCAFVHEGWIDSGAIPVDDPQVWSQRLGEEDLPVSLVGDCGRSRPADSADRSEIVRRTVTADRDGAQTALCRQIGQLSELLSTLDIEFDPLVRVGPASIERNGNTQSGPDPLLGELAGEFAAAPLVEVVSEPTDWDVRVEFVTAGTLDSSLDPPAVQVEASQPGSAVENDNGEAATVVSCSVSGVSLLAAFGARAAETDRSVLPVWLAPTQVRLIPIESTYLDYCEQLTETLADGDIRVDIDDRDEPVSARIEAAERAWVPYYAVVGDDEMESERLAVFDRGANSEREVSVDELSVSVRDDVAGFPHQRQSLPRRLSESPTFV